MNQKCKICGMFLNSYNQTGECHHHHLDRTERGKVEFEQAISKTSKLSILYVMGLEISRTGHDRGLLAEQTNALYEGNYPELICSEDEQACDATFFPKKTFTRCWGKRRRQRQLNQNIVLLPWKRNRRGDR